MSDIEDSSDNVGVAVVNLQAPVLETRGEVLENCLYMADMVDGVKLGYAGLDLIIFPEYAVQGFHPMKWGELCTTVPGPETDILSEACYRNRTWGVFPIVNRESPDDDPFNSLVLIDHTGEIALVYHQVHPRHSFEPWRPGCEAMVVNGPKGMKLGAAISADANIPELMREAVGKGAELIVCSQSLAYPFKEQNARVMSTRAWENIAYVAAANLAGRDKRFAYFGHSGIYHYDGNVLTHCLTSPDEITYAELSVKAVRKARNTCTAYHPYFYLKQDPEE